MLNTFHYDENIPALAKSKLVDRESLCQEAVIETSPLSWSVAHDDKGRALYTLTKKGEEDVLLGRFTEQEIMSMPDDEFKDRVLTLDMEDQRRGAGDHANGAMA
jgi:hypothetical protein